MSILDDVLREEMQRIERIKSAYTDEIASLPKGTIVQKKIAGKEYSYLQYRCGNKVLSHYVKEENLNETYNKINRRKFLEQDMKRISRDKARIEKVLKDDK